MGKDMVKVHTLFLMEASMLGNGKMGKDMVKGHSLLNKGNLKDLSM